MEECRGKLEKQVHFQIVDLLNLEVDLLSFDTTSIYFEAKEADEKVLRDWRGEKTSARDDADEASTVASAVPGDDVAHIGIGGAVQGVVSHGEQRVGAASLPSLGQQRGGQVGVAERQRPVRGDQLHLPP